MNIRLCPECGVPEQITLNCEWLHGGVMFQRNCINADV